MNLGALIGVEGLAHVATGPDLLAQLSDRTVDAGAELLIDDVSAIAHDGERFIVAALDGRFEAAAVIVATGLTPGTTGLEGETRFDGVGLSHCAHCDAALFAGQPVAVAGRDVWAVEEALELAGYAAKVTLIADGPIHAPTDRLEAVRSCGAIVVREGRIAALEGGDALEGLRIEGVGGSDRIAVRGLFPQTGRVPALGIVADHLADAEGLFIAGDAGVALEHTIAAAIADGARAGQNAVAWVKARAGA